MKVEDRLRKEAYDLASRVQYEVSMSDLDPIHHNQAVEDLLFTALAEAEARGAREERERTRKLIEEFGDEPQDALDSIAEWISLADHAAAIRSREAKP